MGEINENRPKTSLPKKSTTPTKMSKQNNSNRKASIRSEVVAKSSPTPTEILNLNPLVHPNLNFQNLNLSDDNKVIILTQLYNRFSKRKNIYSVASEFYNKGSFILFTIPLLLLQIANAILPSFIRDDATELKVLITIISAISAGLIAFQSRLRWAELGEKFNRVACAYSGLCSDAYFESVGVEIDKDMKQDLLPHEQNTSPTIMPLGYKPKDLFVFLERVKLLEEHVTSKVPQVAHWLYKRALRIRHEAQKREFNRSKAAARKTKLSDFLPKFPFQGMHGMNFNPPKTEEPASGRASKNSHPTTSKSPKPVKFAKVDPEKQVEIDDDIIEEDEKPRENVPPLASRSTTSERPSTGQPKPIGRKLTRIDSDNESESDTSSLTDSVTSDVVLTGFASAKTYINLWNRFSRKEKLYNKNAAKYRKLDICLFTVPLLILQVMNAIFPAVFEDNAVAVKTIATTLSAISAAFIAAQGKLRFGEISEQFSNISRTYRLLVSECYFYITYCNLSGEEGQVEAQNFSQLLKFLNVSQKVEKVAKDGMDHLPDKM